MGIEIDWNNPDEVDKLIGIPDIDVKENFSIKKDVIDIVEGFDLEDFNLLEKNIDLSRGAYELLFNGKLIARWNFVLGETDILIKYVEKFTNTKGFGTLMYIDFLVKLKNMGIKIIKSETKSPEVVSIYNKLITNGILSDTEKGYFIN